MFGSKVKAIGFTALIEGIMMTADAGWLGAIALGYLVVINAVTNGCRLAQRDTALSVDWPTNLTRSIAAARGRDSNAGPEGDLSSPPHGPGARVSALRRRGSRRSPDTVPMTAEAAPAAVSAPPHRGSIRRAVAVMGSWYERRMERFRSSQISSGVGDLLGRVVKPTADGWWDLNLTPVHLEPNLRDLHSPYLCSGDKRIAVSMAELGRAAGYLPLGYPEHSNLISCIVLMREQWVQVFWSRGGVCLFQNVESRHLEVLRVIQGSMSYAEEREEIGVSFTDTIRSLSAYYGCRGEHRRPCPDDRDRARSLIAPDGAVKTTLFEKLREFGLASDA